MAVVNCPRCGTTLAQEERACPRCGAASRAAPSHAGGAPSRRGLLIGNDSEVRVDPAATVDADDAASRTLPSRADVATPRLDLGLEEPETTFDPTATVDSDEAAFRAAPSPGGSLEQPEATFDPTATVDSDEAAFRAAPPRVAASRGRLEQPEATYDATATVDAGADTAPKAKPKSSRSRPKSNDEASTGTKDSLIGQTLQAYVIEERIGVGGTGYVYRAVQPLIGKHVAIKVLRGDVVTDSRDIERLLEEARVVNSIKHRGIINIFGAGALDDGRHYLIMELLEGESLDELLTREGTLPAGDAVIILEQVLSALAAAHAAGVVHRDLKPANVFLVHEGTTHYVKLLDFGLARRKQTHVTRIAGTPDYISPEHARGRPAGPPADLYAFGVLCFHVLTGRLPFEGATPMAVMEQHVNSPPPVPREINPEMPKALSELILKLLAKAPGQRPDAQQIEADLRAATRALRTTSTKLSLMTIEPVKRQHTEVRQESKRVKALNRQAALADLKRKASRQRPMIIGAVIALLLGIAAYLLWPGTSLHPLRNVQQPKNPASNALETKADPGGEAP